MKRGLSRRHFLGGAGAMIGLPLLTSLLPRRARGADVPRKQRFISLYVPCGMVMANWRPAEAGPAWTSTPILAPLDPYRSQTLVLSGIANTPGRSEGGGDHAAGTGSFLTCVHVKKTAGTDISAGISLDQKLAPVLSAGLPFPSLELGSDSGITVGDCDTGYSCAYTSTVSWTNATTPLPKQTKPRGVFDRMFAGYDPDASIAEIEKRKAYRKSVLDYGLDDATSLRTKLGRTDQVKLDEYMNGVREVELRLDRPVAVCRPGERPEAAYTFAETTRLMMDLIAIACECDQTRVITMMIGNAGSYNTHPQVGVGEAHHELSHHMNSADSLAKLTLINNWEVGELAYLMGRLAAIDDGEGQTGLDNSILFFGGEISDGDAHNHDDLPIIVAGGGSGRLIPGQHIEYTNETQGNLFVSLLNAYGLPDTSFGDDGTRPIPGLLL